MINHVGSKQFNILHTLNNRVSIIIIIIIIITVHTYILYHTIFIFLCVPLVYNNCNTWTICVGLSMLFLFSSNFLLCLYIFTIYHTCSVDTHNRFTFLLCSLYNNSYGAICDVQHVIANCALILHRQHINVGHAVYARWYKRFG